MNHGIAHVVPPKQTLEQSLQRGIISAIGKQLVRQPVQVLAGKSGLAPCAALPKQEELVQKDTLGIVVLHLIGRQLAQQTEQNLFTVPIVMQSKML